MKIRVLLSLVTVVLSFVVTCSSRAQWVQAIGPSNGSVQGFAISGPDIYAATTGRGVFHSADNGKTWVPVSSGLKSESIYKIAASGIDIFASSSGSVYHLRRGDTIWTETDAGLPHDFVIALAANATNLFAGTYDSGVFISTNNGWTWSPANHGLTTLSIRALAVSGTNVYIGTKDSGVFLSTNNGTDWTNLALVKENISGFLIDGAKVFVATSQGVYLSIDNGASWAIKNTGLTDTNVYALSRSGSNLFAATSHGIFLSKDDGTSWSKSKTNLKIINVRSLAAKDSNVFAGDDDGVYYSTNYGTDWARSKTGLTDAPVYSLASSRVVTLEGIIVFLLAGTHNGVFISEDSNKVWRQVGTLNTNAYAVSSINLGGGGDIYAGTDSGVFRYRFPYGTASWEPWNQGLISDGVANVSVRTLAVSGWGLFAGTKQSGVLLASIDHPTWTFLNSGLTETDIRSLIEIPPYLYAGTVNGVFRSTNTGRDWSAVGLPNRTVSAFARSGKNLFAATDLGVFLSTDNAGSWTQMNNGLTNIDVRAITAYGPNIFVGTDGGTVFLSRDYGNHWSSITDGLECTSVTGLIVINPFIHAGTSENGIWRRSLSELALSAVSEELTAQQSLTIYPNPVTTSTTISITPEAGGYAEISIVNMLGQVVATVNSGMLDASEHSFTWDAARMAVPRGMYECVVRMNARVQTMPIVVQ
jgi:photosystem II stability/assembly factor-like uncharacterized protein